jgi:hypothetical protein
MYSRQTRLFKAVLMVLLGILSVVRMDYNLVTLRFLVPLHGRQVILSL